MVISEVRKYEIQNEHETLLLSHDTKIQKDGTEHEDKNTMLQCFRIIYGIRGRLKKLIYMLSCCQIYTIVIVIGGN